MKFLPAARGRAVRTRRLGLQSGAFWVGAGALALIAGGCGAGGEDGPGVEEAPDGVGPVLGGGGTNGGGGGIPTAGQNCTAANCDLAGDGQPLQTPAGCGDGVLTADEACDDGNRIAGDGCAETCLATEAGFSCAAPGQACRQIARCGDGLVAATEQCDDGNATPGDGCSARCRLELGKKCEGSPSVCTDTTCGDGVMEGAEACDDGNNTPFDGCSPICLKEPNCAGLSCTSDCGDGLLINEACDDGNLIDGDGCSSTCTLEIGFECVAQAACEEIGGQCALRVPAIFRDFSGDHPDFGDKNCSSLARGAVGAELDADGRPVIGNAAAAACLSDGANFGQWYRSIDGTNVTSVGEVVLFDNGNGGYVNRFGAEGEPFTAIRQGTERQTGATEASCTTTCTNEAQNGNAPFDGPLRCADLCRPINDDRQQLTVGQLNQLNNQLTQAENANPPDPVAIADLEAQIADVQAQIDQLTADLTTCQTDCQTELDARVASCVPSCKPCGGNPAMFCLGGVVDVYDGTPLFFPVDGNIDGPTANFGPASIPDAYGYDAFPFESTVFPGAPDHNFYFTSEVQYWFKYDADTLATLNFLGDDDVWVFLNGRLAVDLGGIHVPSEGSVTINAGAGTVNSTTVEGRATSVPVNANSTTAAFGLEPGNVYKITVFHAERQVTGSSFKLTLAGFEATPSDCTAICGDGVLSFGEECDDGVNDGGYGECNPGCVLGPFCGDSIRQPEFGEDCDIGPVGDGLCRGCRQIQLR